MYDSVKTNTREHRREENGHCPACTGTSDRRTERIRLWGIVQGVGFRPHVAKVADAMGMKGCVLNTGGLVEITVTDTAERISAFLHALQEKKPAPAEIVHIKREPAESREFDGFEITGSAYGDDETVMIPADLAICPSCLRELYDHGDPRQQHPFISCMICGPRYSIIDELPYDRCNTSMTDFPMCDFCREEYTDLHDRRYHAQTISCHHCGPQLLWVDGGTCQEHQRERAAAGGDSLSALSVHCDTSIPRRHDAALPCSQAVTLPHDHYGALRSRVTPLNDATALLDRATSLLKRGGVILFKSVGGYNLVADPLNDDAASKLRRIKGREQKPFAIMFRSAAQIREYCHVDPVEERLLESSARPILLLERTASSYEKPTHGDTSDAIPEAIVDGTLTHADSSEEALRQSSGGSDSPVCRSGSRGELSKSRFIGSFLPCFAAQYMLLDRISPLIFTSANLSDMPMIKDDAEAFAFLEANPEIDGMLYNERQIRVRVDDSVVRVIDGQPQMIRRSKGYAPMPLYVETGKKKSNASSADPAAAASTDIDVHTGRTPWMQSPSVLHPETSAPFHPSVFAAGGQLKNSFALTKGNFVYMSQYFGDLDSVENQQVYQENISRMSDLFRISPSVVVCDMHPLYDSTQFAERYAKAHGLPLVKVQHHHAHVASVMAENQLTGKVIGVSFDGTGYGTDGCIWGGEFLLCEGAEMERIAHLRYVDMMGGDSSVKDGVRSALSYMHAYEQRTIEASRRIGTRHHAASRSADHVSESIPTSSGSDTQTPDLSIEIDLADIIAYGRDRLLQHPSAALVIPALQSSFNTIKSSSTGRLFDAVSALLGICDYNHYEGQCAILLEDAAAFAQKHPGQRAECDLALAFHHRIIDMILEQCRQIRKKYNTGQVALTGGTFQNKILMEGALARLRADGFTPYYNISVSPNDGGIALGQAYVAMQKR